MIMVDTPEKLLKVLEKCLTHAKMFRYAREELYAAQQQQGENITAFYSRILEMYKLAQFPQDTNFLLVDKLVHGCINPECKKKLMSKDKDVTVPQCLEILRKYEAVQASMKRLELSTTRHVDSAYQDPTRRSQAKGARQHSKKGKVTQKPKNKDCPWCGGSVHHRESCPASKSKCRFCQKEGHFEKKCFKKKHKEKTSKIKIL